MSKYTLLHTQLYPELLSLGAIFIPNNTHLTCGVNTDTHDPPVTVRTLPLPTLVLVMNSLTVLIYLPVALTTSCAPPGAPSDACTHLAHRWQWLGFLSTKPHCPSLKQHKAAHWPPHTHNSSDLIGSDQITLT
jgi:hypothetical protein